MLKPENQGTQGKRQTGGFARELKSGTGVPGGAKALGQEGSPKKASNKSLVRAGRLAAGGGPHLEGAHYSPRKGD